jgi:hypothetical protein
MAAKKKVPERNARDLRDEYGEVLETMVSLLEAARRLSARAVNSVMTATYWEMGRRIVELEQSGQGRAEYGEQVVKQLAVDLTSRFGRGVYGETYNKCDRFLKCTPTFCRRCLQNHKIAQQK